MVVIVIVYDILLIIIDDGYIQPLCGYFNQDVYYIILLYGVKILIYL